MGALSASGWFVYKCCSEECGQCKFLAHSYIAQVSVCVVSSHVHGPMAVRIIKLKSCFRGFDHFLKSYVMQFPECTVLSAR